jgi:hypothetical protein
MQTETADLHVQLVYGKWATSNLISDQIAERAWWRRPNTEHGSFFTAIQQNNNSRLGSP